MVLVVGMVLLQFIYKAGDGFAVVSEVKVV